MGLFVTITGLTEKADPYMQKLTFPVKGEFRVFEGQSGRKVPFVDIPKFASYLSIDWFTYYKRK